MYCNYELELAKLYIYIYIYINSYSAGVLTEKMTNKFNNIVKKTNMNRLIRVLECKTNF